MNIKIIYEDENICIINKPPGIVVNNAQSVKSETVQSWAFDRFFQNIPRSESEFYQRAGVVHRLDKDTSGVLCLAKNESAFLFVKEQFMNRTAQKVYLALVHGKVEPKVAEISAPVGRLPWNREHFGILSDGRPAITKFECIDFYRKNNSNEKNPELFTFIKLFPKTGRTHQIRVHMKYVNHPVVADNLYAGRKLSKTDLNWAPRLMLHAFSLTIKIPQSTSVCTFEAELPDDIISSLAQLHKL